MLMISVASHRDIHLIAVIINRERWSGRKSGEWQRTQTVYNYPHFATKLYQAFTNSTLFTNWNVFTIQEGSVDWADINSRSYENKHTCNSAIFTPCKCAAIYRPKRLWNIWMGFSQGQAVHGYSVPASSFLLHCLCVNQLVTTRKVDWISILCYWLCGSYQCEWSEPSNDGFVPCQLCEIFVWYDYSLIMTRKTEHLDKQQVCLPKAKETPSRQI